MDDHRASNGNGDAGDACYRGGTIFGLCYLCTVSFVRRSGDLTISNRWQTSECADYSYTGAPPGRDLALRFSYGYVAQFLEGNASLCSKKYGASGRNVCYSASVR